MPSAILPDGQWGIVKLNDGSMLAGYMHLEHDEQNHPELEVDVPASGGWPANIAVIPPSDVSSTRNCSRADVLAFVRTHGWPTGGAISPTIRKAPDADRLPVGSD